jgi:hypothetical protein
MDSCSVNKEIRERIKPLLKDAGFSQFTSRTSWRYATNRIDVVNFQSFNSYLASGVGCTTYSFALRLGCYFAYIPYPHGAHRLKQKEGKLIPHEYECPIRRPLNKGISQPELPRKDIWHVDPEGRFLSPAISDAALTIVKQAFPWFERFSDDFEVLRTLLKEKEQNNGTSGFGANPSPMRSYLTGYAALFLRKPTLAIEHLDRALASGCFQKVEVQLKTDLARVKASMVDSSG